MGLTSCHLFFEWIGLKFIQPRTFFSHFIHSRNKYAKKIQSHTFIQLSCKISAVNKMSLIYAYIHWFFAVFVLTQTPDDWRSIMGRWPHKYLVADWGKYSSAQDNIMCRVCSFSGDPDPISPSLLSMYWRLKTDTDWNTRQWEIMIPPQSLTPSANCIPTVPTLGLSYRKEDPGQFTDSSVLW